MKLTQIAGLAVCLILWYGRMSSGAEPEALWVYAPVNFQVNESTERFLALLKRAKIAGYNAAVVTDSKFGKLDDRPDRYYRNLERSRKFADEVGMELIPCVMPIGHSNSILQNDPNLAAGLPAKDCVFVADQTQATAVPEEALLPGGGFDAAEKNKPQGWDWLDGFGRSTTLDEKVKHSGNAALKMREFSKGSEVSNCRVVKNLKLKPFHQYRLTLWVKTEGFEGGEFKAMPLAKGKSLNYANLGVKSTQDWTRHRIVFNTLERSEVSLYLGLWGGERGVIWMDDVQLETVGGVNLLRREGCPLKVTSEDGQIEYAEGRDFEPWKDPKLGNDPYLGEFSDDHEAPPIRLSKDSRIKPGQKLLVSFYHTAIIYDGQVCCSLVSDDLFKHLQTQVEWIHKYWQPKRYFMQHDEIRVAGHDELAQGRTSGKLLAENARRCQQVIRSINPKAEIVVWSDMFDPYHNARDNYYLAQGTLKESWQGLDPSVGIINWNGGKAKESLAFFSERGHRQIIAGYYDGNVKTSFERWHQSAKDVKGVQGYMYTTWRNRYDDLEAFADLVRARK